MTLRKVEEVVSYLAMFLLISGSFIAWGFGGALASAGLWVMLQLIVDKSND